MSFVRAANPIWSFVDLQGLQLNDEYYAFFLENIFPYLPQPVFQDQNGLIPWSDPLEFLANGTLPDNLYFDSSKVYRIEIRHGNTQDDALIYEINNFIPGNGSPTPSDLLIASDNQITNPQFVFVNFTNNLTITTSGLYNIAPGWFLNLSGTGSAVLTNITNSGNQVIVNNPPFALQLNLSGWTTATLYQQFNMNGALWASTPTQEGAVTMSITAQSNDGVAWPITLVYFPSVGSAQVITTQPISVGSFGVIDGAIDLPESTNSDLSDVAFVQMQITLPPNGDITLSNIQVIGENVPVALPFQQETVEREKDHLFHNYFDSIVFQPKEDLLAGWNFGLNPFQFTSTSPTTAATIASYICDQTILVQKNATASSVSTSQSGFASNLSLAISPLKASNQFALIQYIDPSTIAPYWTYNLSSCVRTGFHTDITKPLRFKMRLIYRSSLPSAIGNAEPISSWVGTDPVFAAGWTAITPPLDPTYVCQNNVFVDFPFNGMELPISAGAEMTLGIVVYTIDDMVMADNDIIRFDKISLVPNDFYVETYPMTWDESLRRCQYYYEKSYNNEILPGTISIASQLQAPQAFFTDGATVSIFAAPFNIQFNTVKRAVPSTIALFSSLAGTGNTVDFKVFGNAALISSGQAATNTNWTLTNSGTKGVSFSPASNTAFTSTASIAFNISANILFQYIIDSRLGV